MKISKKQLTAAKKYGMLVSILASITGVNLFLCFLYFVFLDIYYWNCGLYAGLWKNLGEAIAEGQAFAWANSYGKMMLLTSILSIFVITFNYLSLTKFKYASLINIGLLAILFLIIFGFLQWKISIAPALIIYIACVIVIIGVPTFFGVKLFNKKFHTTKSVKVNHSK
ncbi:MAG: hypothetical protein LBV22_01255 [Mycoplasmataceae bacterium]|jgi:hypothetical protein|nr:hypothetical protein [Mycoplasmataceae bacterium]